MSRTIGICDDQGRAETSREIRLCDDQGSRSPCDIVICDDQCGSVAPLEIVAPAQITTGKCFTVRGGKAPFEWKSSGSIDVSPAGCITYMMGCDFSVTVTDACGQSASYSKSTHSTPCPDGYGAEDIALTGPNPLANGTYQVVGAPGGAEFSWSLVGGTLDVSPTTLSATVSGLEGCTAELTVTSKATYSSAVFAGGECKFAGGACWKGVRNYELPPLTLTGTDAPSVGSQYTALGGKSPYTWSISCGAISSTGQVTSVSGCCGSGAVMVTDACGQSASIAVRFPGGQWVLVSDVSPRPFYSDNGCCTYGGGEDPCNKQITETHGRFRYTDYWTNVKTPGGCDCAPTCLVQPNTTYEYGGDCSPPKNMCVSRKIVWEWRCS